MVRMRAIARAREEARARARARARAGHENRRENRGPKIRTPPVTRSGSCRAEAMRSIPAGMRAEF